MNCKAGDLALIVKSMAGNEGKVVTCLEYLGAPGANLVLAGDNNTTLLLDGGGWWRVDRNLNMFQVHNIKFQDGSVLMRTITTPDMAPYCRDDFMIPIGNVDPEEVIQNEALLSAVPV